MVLDPATRLVHREGERKQGAPSVDPVVLAAWYTSYGRSSQRRTPTVVTAIRGGKRWKMR